MKAVFFTLSFVQVAVLFAAVIAIAVLMVRKLLRATIGLFTKEEAPRLAAPRTRPELLPLVPGDRRPRGPVTAEAPIRARKIS